MSGDAKFLLLGSAPAIPAWWERYGRDFVASGYEIVAINNAHAALDQAPDYWFHSCDYHATSPRRLHPPRAMLATCAELTSPGCFAAAPHFTIRPDRLGNGAILLECLAYFMNKVVAESADRGTIALTGCDLIYEGSCTHFYGTGGKDPLRFGTDWLVLDLCRLLDLAATFPSLALVNVSDARRTLLPFPRWQGVPQP